MLVQTQIRQALTLVVCQVKFHHEIACALMKVIAFCFIEVVSSHFEYIHIEP